ncbi:MAG: hypothetical protein WBG02_14975 [Candidatus Acidiferrum sp.]
MNIAKTLEIIGIVLMVAAGVYGHHGCVASALALLKLAAAVHSAARL